MVRFVFGRLFGVILTVFAVTTLSFFLVRAAPGNPFMNEVRNLPEAAMKARMREYHLNETIWVQYAYYLGDLLRGDFGKSTKYRDRSVTEIISQTFPVSIALGSVAMVIAVVLGLTTGVVAALRQNTLLDYGMMTIALLGISLPSFVIASLLIALFVFQLNWAPLAGWGTLAQIVLPALALALPFAARISRLSRVGMLEVLSEDFIRTAHAKGLRESEIVVKHALKGAILPVVSYLGPAFAAILTGSLVIEQIFFIPGLGKPFVQAAINRDYNLVLGTVIVFSTLLCVFNFLVDMCYTLLDPRVSLKGGGA
ncbi:Oligopeptide transport system permease protein OppB [Planctomycetes bacterium Pan216]|uniref:Oligopeptide transport system permease protein OppB n=1 Tax=Kolteria novifilia TaxID=2527975 RepID=A0A518B222_9BACT|nr:Oligopeptide transport system permease protein OppB [Planctomycetes bacterium Pan216]